MTKNRMNSFLSLCSTPLLTKIRNAETFDVYTKDSPDGPPFLTRIVCECEAMVICDHELYAFSKFEDRKDYQKAVKTFVADRFEVLHIIKSMVVRTSHRLLTDKSDPPLFSWIVGEIYTRTTTCYKGSY